MPHDHDPTPDRHDTFKLADEYMRGLLHYAGETLILYGKATINHDGLPYVQDEEKVPYVFSYSIPLNTIKDLFFRNDDIILTSAQAEYIEPHRLDEPQYNELQTSVHVTVHGRLPSGDVDVEYAYYIADDVANGMSARVDVEYSRDGKRLDSPLQSADVAMSLEQLEAILSDRYESMGREATHDDIEAMRLLFDYIHDHPQREQ